MTHREGAEMSENSDRAILNKIGQPGTAEVVAISGTTAATASALVEGATYVVTSPVPFHFAAAATAATTDTWWPGTTVPLYITMDSASKLSFVIPSGGSTGNVYVTRLYGHGV
jgi:hypothetical protein